MTASPRARITRRRFSHDASPSRADAARVAAGPRQYWTEAFLARVMKLDDPDAWVPHPQGNGRTLWKPRGGPQ